MIAYRIITIINFWGCITALFFLLRVYYYKNIPDKWATYYLLVVITTFLNMAGQVFAIGNVSFNPNVIKWIFLLQVRATFFWIKGISFSVTLKKIYGISK